MFRSVDGVITGMAACGEIGPAPVETESLVDIARRVFGPAGVELDLPHRGEQMQRPPPDFSGKHGLVLADPRRAV